ncbi:succinoglycan biosynthesis protein ExoA [Marmoricola sp. OAE513]|uniref:glycosyltransferase family 2 protein n=1 Tax=Marmoricola sp. OAE513 TaxID=2817894 RepID=UPI001D6D7D0D
MTSMMNLPGPTALSRLVATQRQPAPTDLHPPVSVFMAIRDEEAGLAESVRRVFAQDYAGEIELVLAVAPSVDSTWGLALELALREPRLRLVENPDLFTPHGLNAAIAAASHDYLIRVDGHAFIPLDYVSRIVEVLRTTGAANVGGRMVPVGDGPVSEAVAVSMSSRFGIGGGAFHVGGEAGEQPTVYLGAFRRDALASVGGYDETFLRAQDWELNHRLRTAGHQVWFDPSIGVTYRPRSDWRSFARQQFRTGGWRRRVIGEHPGTVSARYLAPPVAVVVIVLGVLLAAQAPLLAGWLLIGLAAPLGYLAAITALGLHEGRRHPWHVRRRVPVAMALMHLSWGIGFLFRAR